MNVKELLVHVTVRVDQDEVDTPEKLAHKKKQIQRTIEDIGPEVGVFVVEEVYEN